jgi:hypothetical protein
MMKKLRATIVFSLMMVIGISCIFFSSCREKSKEGMIIITRSSEKAQKNDTSADNSLIINSHSQIVALNPDNPEGSPEILTSEFYSAQSPRVSYDGKYLLFAAQLKQNDTWQIWEMDLNKMKAREVTNSSDNCTDPAYLPLGRIVFSKITANDTLKAGRSLYTCNLDGTNLKRITFNPHTYFASNVLSDGRVLTIGKQVFPFEGASMYMILRPDGTKSELFYKGIDGSKLTGPGLETANSRIIFVESEKSDTEEGDLISISYNRPLHSRVNLTSAIKGDFHAVFPQKSGNLLVSYRKLDSDRYALYEFDPEKKELGKTLYSNNDYDVLEVVVTGKHERPKKLPSEVDMGVKTGLLMCQDINVSNVQTSTIVSKASRIKIVGIDSTLGYVDVAEDGSFYLKVMADKPFQIQTVDKDGRVSRSSCGWIWLRPNERRGCVGCHEDPENVPANRVPLAVKTSPVVIPVHINKVVEKKVSLE